MGEDDEKEKNMLILVKEHSFSEEQAKKALEKCNNNLNEALKHL